MALGVRHRFSVIANTVTLRCFAVCQSHDADLVLLDAARAENQARIDQLFGAWDALRTSSAQVTRYNSPASFQRRIAVSQSAAEQPFAMVLESDEAVSVVAIGHIETRRASNTIGKLKIPLGRLRTLYIGESGVVHGEQAVGVDLVLECLMRLLTSGQVDLAKFHDVVVGSGWHATLSRYAGIEARVRLRAKERWQTQVLDPITRQRLEHHSGKTRRNIRMRDKHLVEAFGGDVRLERVATRDQVEGFFAEAAQIVSQSYQAALGLGVQAHRSDLKAYLYELADDGMLRGYLLRAGGRAIAYAQGDLNGGTLYLWSTAYLPEFKELAPGIVLMHRIIDSLAEEGVPLLDFGWGDNAYKQRLGSHKLAIVDLRVYGDHLYSRLAFAIDKASHHLDAKLREVCASNGLIDRLRVIWRNRIAAKHRAWTNGRAGGALHGELDAGCPDRVTAS